jgi:signal peptidase II
MLALLLICLIVVTDQFAKFLVGQHFYPGDSLPIVPGFFHLTYVRNSGAAWGMLGGLNGWLAGLSVVMLLVLVVFRRSLLSDTIVHRVALGLMVGGIVGNLMDRLRLSYVVDFLDFFWRTHHFPAFNVADSAICIGVGLYAVTSLGLLGGASPATAADRPEADQARDSGETTSAPKT